MTDDGFFFYFLLISRVIFQANKSVPEKLSNGIQIGINYRLCAVERVRRSMRDIYFSPEIYYHAFLSFTIDSIVVIFSFIGIVGNVQKRADTVVQITATRWNGL